MLRGKSTAKKSYIKGERSKINNLNFYPKIMQKEKQTKPKATRKEVIKIKMQVNEIDNRKTAEKSNVTKIQF